jgi:hypothetical protein
MIHISLTGELQSITATAWTGEETNGKTRIE